MMGVRKHTPARTCERCGNPYERKPKEMPYAFSRRRFCSYSCAQTPAPFDWAWFDSLIDKSGDCWLWTGRLSDKGYGVVWKDGRPQYAHRLSYERATGAPLGEMHGLHRCDTPACVRPDHIFPGTQRDNNLDMWAKGRAKIARGEAAPAAILTEQDARDVIADKRPALVVAAERGVSPSTIKAVRQGRNWKHLGLSQPQFRFRPTPEQRAEILAADKSEARAIAEQYGVPRQAISDIRRKARRH